MAKYTAYSAASTPLDGTEVNVVVQGGATKKVTVLDYTTGQAIAPLTVNATGTTQSTSTSTGAIITAGGIGVAKNIYVGGVVVVPAGTAAAPSIDVGTDHSGLYQRTTSLLNVAVGGVRIAEFNAPGASANYLQFFANNTPTVSAGGSNISLNLSGTGTSGVSILTGGTSGTGNSAVEVARFSNTASGVNYNGFTPGATGNGVTWSAQGSDSVVDCVITPKSTGVVNINGTAAAVSTATCNRTVAVKINGTTLYMMLSTTA